jgi:hypothetical protein
MKTHKFLFLIFALFVACNPDKVDTRKVKEELKNQKIKKISEGEILGQAESEGIKITDSLQKLISSKLDSALAKGDVENAIPFCILGNYSLVKRLEKTYNASITRTTFADKLRNEKNAPDTHQKEILDAYLYNIEKGLPFFIDVQAKDKEIGFNAPIILTENNCLRCHGSVGKDLSDKEYQKILSFYPKDKLINMKKKDFMGMWTVKFNKTEFIKNLK